MAFALRHLKQLATFLIAIGPHFHWAVAQNTTEKETALTCETSKTMRAPQLYGEWLVTFTKSPAGMPATAVMRLQKHQEFSDSLSGTVSRDLGAAAASAKIAGLADKAALAGDFEDGLLLLDESSNNISITGTWNGQLTESSCGRQINGVWRNTSAGAPADAPELPFTLTRRPGW